MHKGNVDRLLMEAVEPSAKPEGDWNLISNMDARFGDMMNEYIKLIDRT